MFVMLCEYHVLGTEMIRHLLGPKIAASSMLQIKIESYPVLLLQIHFSTTISSFLQVFVCQTQLSSTNSIFLLKCPLTYWPPHYHVTYTPIQYFSVLQQSQQDQLKWLQGYPMDRCSSIIFTAMSMDVGWVLWKWPCPSGSCIRDLMSMEWRDPVPTHHHRRRFSRAWQIAAALSLVKCRIIQIRTWREAMGFIWMKWREHRWNRWLDLQQVYPLETVGFN